MSAERNKQIIHEVVETVFNQKQTDKIDQYVLPDYKHNNPGLPPGAAGFKLFHGALVQAFPDLHLSSLDLIAEGDRVAGRMLMRGTHTGDFMGHPPTGKSFEVTFIEIWHFEHGKVSEHWLASDRPDLMEQLGISPKE